MLFSGHILLIISIIRAHTDSTPISTFYVRSVQLSHVQLFATPWTAALQASLSFTISWSLLKFVSIESVIPSNPLIRCHPTPFSSCLSIFQHQGLFQWVSSSHQVAKIVLNAAKSKWGQGYEIRIEIHLNTGCTENRVLREMNWRNLVTLWIFVATKNVKVCIYPAKSQCSSFHMDRAPNDLWAFHHEVPLPLAEQCRGC